MHDDGEDPAPTGNTTRRDQVVAWFRLLVGVGIFLLMLAFLRACFSPPMLPSERPPAPVDAPRSSGDMPTRY